MSNRWLGIDQNSYQAKLKKAHTSPVASNVIQQKALKLADKLKQGYLIKEYSKRGESQSAHIEQIPEVREELKDVLKKCRKEDIFNCDETGGFYW
nr:10196_t:CDS:2 [Entrophospora candida]